ncbi:hypothetical protein HAX54_010178 [Datura stramonium]|uniref:Ribulose-phosphate 3-epimerase n=1 Tax=Datura stramonium TaxID=4076 RepID=A0ABS8TGS2_DATST|nr:hypothetical protein [Datura stramonium]
MVKAIIAPSMLSSDSLLIWHLKQMACSTAAPIGSTWTSCHFVPNLTLGTPVIESLRKHTKAYLDCHLMVTNPLDYVEPLGKAGASGFTFHVEASRDNWQELVQRIKSKGMKPGVSLKPGTPIEEVYPLLDGENSVELVLVMTVEPGFGGQKFMPEMMDKVADLRTAPSTDKYGACLLLSQLCGKTSFKKPRRPYEKERLDAELKLVGEYGLRCKRELWRVQYALSQIVNAAKNGF